VFDAGAVMFHGVTDDTLARAAAGRGDPVSAGRLRDRALATYERLDARWWHGRLASWQPPAVSSETEPAGRAKAHLRPAPGGDLWLVGSRAVPLRPLRGFGYLRALLRAPGRPIAALDLVGGGAGVVVQQALGDVVDRRAMAAYRERLRDLEQELDEAEQWSDTARLSGLRAERDALVDQVVGAAGLGGRSRLAGSSAERARVAVTKAIGAAIDRASAPSTSRWPGTCAGPSAPA